MSYGPKCLFCATVCRTCVSCGGACVLAAGMSVAPLAGTNKTAAMTRPFLCEGLKDYRTFKEDFLKLVEFAEWYKDYIA